jgi:hypothetical protein
MTGPLIEFSQFAAPHRWLLRRGEPPWLDAPRLGARAFRVSLVFVVLGLASAWVTALALHGLMFNPGSSRAAQNWDGLIYAVAWAFAAPAVYSLVVLLPLSRWMGRRWVASLLLVVTSYAAWWVGILGLVFLSEQEWAREISSPVRLLSFGTPPSLMCLMIGLPHRRFTWCAAIVVYAMTLLAGAVTVNGIGVLEKRDLWQRVTTAMPVWANVAQVNSALMSPVAIGFGVLLWRPRPEGRSSAVTGGNFGPPVSCR